jgi:hypothetical protein
LPGIINKSLSNMSPEVTVKILTIIDCAMEIEMHFRDSNEIKMELF